MARTVPTALTDTGTPELARRRTLRLELTGRGHAVRARVTDTCELDRLRALERITSEQHSAGDTLARNLHRAGMLGMATSRFLRAARGSDISHSTSDSLAMVGDAIAWIDHIAGPAARSALLDVLLLDARTRDLALVRSALDALLDRQAPRAQRQTENAAPLWD